MNKWFDKLKVYSNHSVFVCVMVILWLYLEHWLAFWINSKKIEDIELMFWILMPIFLVLFFMKLAVVNHFKVSPLTIRKMMTNALGLRWLSLLFVLTFTMQLAWFVDAAFQLFVAGDTGAETKWQCLLTFSSLIIINLLFPIAERTKNKLSSDTRTLLVSGLSGKDVITSWNMNLFLKPFEKYPIKSVIVVLSENYLKFQLADDFKKLGEEDFIEICDEYNKSDEVEVRRNLFQRLLERLLNNKTNRKIEVVLSEPVDYDDFDDIYMETSKLLNRYEKGTNETVVFITPGSSTISSALTPHAIKGQRMLLFAEQNKSGWPLKEAELDVFTVEDLLNELWGEYEIDSQK